MPENMNQERVRNALKFLASADRERQPSADVEARLVERFRRVADKKRRRERALQLAAIAAAATLLVLPLKLWVQNSEFRSQESGVRSQNSEFRSQNSERRTQNPELRNSLETQRQAGAQPATENTSRDVATKQNSESRTQNSKFRTPDETQRQARMKTGGENTSHEAMIAQSHAASVQTAAVQRRGNSPEVLASSKPLAASNSLAASTLLARKPVFPKQGTRVSAPGVTSDVKEVATEFFPLIEPAPPLERGEIVRVRVPSSEMLSFGLPVPDGRWDGSVDADVLIGQEGLARAIRFVRVEGR